MRPYFLAVIALFATPADVSAYLRTRVAGDREPARWSTPRIELVVDAASVPQDLSAHDVLDTVRAAARAWSRQTCSAVQLSASFAPSEVGARRDAVHAVVFQTREWCKNGVRRSGNCYDRRIAAMTTVHPSAKPLASGETEIVDADIELNAVDFTWRTGETAATTSTELDLEAVLIHELGHVLGLAHPCALRSGKLVCEGPHGTNRSVMVGGADLPSSGMPVEQHELGDDDIRAICEIYPAAEAEQSPWPSLASVALAVMSVVVLVTLRLMAKRRARPRRD